jgi:MFS family permease
VFNAYVIAFGGLLLAGGKLADLVGARRVFAAGWVVLAVGSIVAGLAGGVGAELAGRALQGAGAALIAPAALTLLMMLFGRDPRELTKALALYGAAAPAGGTAGVFLGGVLTEYASWPWVFFVNVPIAILVLAVTRAALPGGSGSRVKVDVLGAVAVTGGLAAAVYGIVTAPEVGWGAGQTWLVLGAAAALLVGFFVLQANRRAPLLRLSIFSSPNLGAANLAQVLLGAAWIPMWFFLNLYLQQVLGYSAFPSGAALLPMTALIMAGMVLLAPRVIGAVGPKTSTVAGLAILAAGLLWLAQVDPDGSYTVDVLPASLVAALGMSLAFIPSLGTAISAAPPQDGGLASGIVNTSYQVGSALGLAVITAIASAAGSGRAGDLGSLTDGYSAAFVAAAAMAGAGAVLAALLLRSDR